MTRSSTSRRSYDRWLEELVGPWVPHCPTPHQTLALITDRREVFYGGAAGGGKSDWLLMSALQYADVPGYSALLVRRTFPMLSQAGGLIERSKEWLAGTDAVWNEARCRWHFPSGATLQFGHLQYEDSKYNYQGGEYQLIGVDELTQFTETQYTYLFSRARRLEGSPLPIRIRATSNPGGTGHDWVKARFVSSLHNERAFVRARLSDNPHLDAEEYAATLAHLHPYDRAQLLEGDWDTRPPGSRFKREWFGILEVAPVAQRSVRFWDLAASVPTNGSDPDWSVGLKMSRVGDEFVIEDVQRFRGTPQTVDARVMQTAQIDGRNTAIRMEQEPGSSGKIAIQHFRTLLAGFDFRGIPSTGDKILRSNPLASYAEAGRIKLLSAQWTEDFLRELEMFAPKCSHDDQVDAASGAFSALTQVGVTPADLYGEAANVGA